MLLNIKINLEKQDWTFVRMVCEYGSRMQSVIRHNLFYGNLVKGSIFRACNGDVTGSVPEIHLSLFSFSRFLIVVCIKSEFRIKDYCIGSL